MPPTRRDAALAGVAALTVALTVGAAASAQPMAAPLPTGGEPIVLDPAEFTTRITNPYWPMRPGDRWREELVRRTRVPSG